MKVKSLIKGKQKKLLRFSTTINVKTIDNPYKKGIFKSEYKFTYDVNHLKLHLSFVERIIYLSPYFLRRKVHWEKIKSCDIWFCISHSIVEWTQFIPMKFSYMGLLYDYNFKFKTHIFHALTINYALTVKIFSKWSKFYK